MSNLNEDKQEELFELVDTKEVNPEEENEMVEENKSVEKEVKETLVLPLGGTPTNDTLFPKSEKLVWKEIKRVIDEMVENMKDENFRLLIPVWNKYDLEFLRAAEKHNVPVTFVLPFKTWGESKLPKFQTDLVIRMKNRESTTIEIPTITSFTERVQQSVIKADIVVGLDNGVGMEQFFESINASDAVAKQFPIDRMDFLTEEEGQALLEKESVSADVLNMKLEDVLPGLQQKADLI